VVVVGIKEVVEVESPASPPSVVPVTEPIVVTGLSLGVAEITFSPPATHADVRRAMERKAKAALRIDASVEMDFR
jgi:hypothetical protein